MIEDIAMWLVLGFGTLYLIVTGYVLGDLIDCAERYDE